MIYVFPNHYGTHEVAESAAHEAAKEAAKEAARIGMNALAEHVGIKKPSTAPAFQKPKDWEYMRQSGEVLKDLPETWEAYEQDEKGRMSIIKMEYEELLKAKTPEEMSHELVHLGSATLHLWRLLNDAE